ncbi:MAG TPA: prolyl oligopeptidase family serine peptidase [Chthoniobacteraceae bacterium]|nr:prolyl oligopeptidase family serine peptidase [Chthoniobacteraceae bacterium]
MSSRASFPAIIVVLGALASAQPPPTQKMVPPKGAAILEADRAELEKGVTELGQNLAELKQNPMFADVAIFHKAVDWALRHDEFMDAKQAGPAKNLLAVGRKRADELKAGGTPSWVNTSSPRAYVSRIDGSVQPYGLVLPNDWQPGEKRQRPVLLWFHGRSENLTELAFVNGQMTAKAELAVPGALIINLYGRFCNASKFAGEVDAFEALEDVARRTPIDRSRIGVAGFSMGGASVWHLSTHHPGLWCAASPGAGFAETAIYAGIFKEGKTPPPWWEQTLYNCYDATTYAANLANVALKAYSGELDPQKASADLMEKTLAEHGMKLDRLVGPQTGHKYESGTKKELETWLAARFSEGRKENPAKVDLVTYTLRYNRCDWVTIDSLGKHWDRAEVHAELVDEGTVRVTTKNVTALTLRFDKDPLPLDKTHPPRVIIDEVELKGPAVKAPWVASFQKVDGKWSSEPNSKAEALTKFHALQGPIDDAFLDRFIFVRPTGKPLNPIVGEWAMSELKRAITEWRRVFRGDAIVKDDTAITPEDIASANLVLWGDPASNTLIARVLKSLPLKWTQDSLEFGKAKLDAAHYAPVLIHPNPLNQKRYVVLNSSFTFRMGSRTSNSLQTPKLPDWALIDLRTPPSDTQPGLIYDAGFFNEDWRPQLTD